MIKAELYSISSNDFLMEDFLGYEPEDPWDEFGWFGLDIGTPNAGGQDYFQCLVTTTRARHRAVAGSKDSRCVVIEPYEPQQIIKSLTDRINSIEGVDWCHIVDQLREFMRWEYEGMAGSSGYFPEGPT